MGAGDSKHPVDGGSRERSQASRGEQRHPLVSICLATRNRKDEVLVALESCFAQTYRPLEVIVFEDASKDETERLVRARFPAIRYIRLEKHTGIAQIRNLGLQEARGELVFSIDDDAFYTDRHTIERAVQCFREHPDAAIVAMAYVEPYRQNAPRMADLPDGREVIALGSFISCAYGIRRQAGLQVGNYRGFYFYRGEEPDLAIRLLDRGYSILYVSTPPVVHLFSCSRDWDRMMPLGVRNTFLFTVLNVPHPFLVPRLAINAVKLFCYKISLRGVPRRICEIIGGLIGCIPYLRWRRPVRGKAYRRYRSLPGHGAQRADHFGCLQPATLDCGTAGVPLDCRRPPVCKNSEKPQADN